MHVRFRVWWLKNTKYDLEKKVEGWSKDPAETRTREEPARTAVPFNLMM